MTFKVVGLTNTVLTCDCCGRTDLTKSVRLFSDETGLVHYGLTCAGRAMRWPGGRERIAHRVAEALDPQTAAAVVAEDTFEQALATLTAGIDGAATAAELSALLRPACDACERLPRGYRAALVRLRVQQYRALDRRQQLEERAA